MKIDTTKLRVNFAIGATHAAELRLNFNPHNKVQCKHNTAKFARRFTAAGRRAPTTRYPFAEYSTATPPPPSPPLFSRDGGIALTGRRSLLSSILSFLHYTWISTHCSRWCFMGMV
ncbi:unnamed protein product, partial [Iphiclides podalirius]